MAGFGWDCWGLIGIMGDLSRLCAVNRFSSWDSRGILQSCRRILMDHVEGLKEIGINERF